MKRQPFVLLALPLLGVTACAAAPPEEAPAAARQRVVDGELSPASEDGVLILRAEPETPEERLCSASLVAPNLLLTARHCVSYLTEAPFRCNLRGEAIDNEEGGGDLGAHVPARSIEIYGADKPRDEPLARGRRVLSTESPTICADDLAFVVLDRSIELPVMPLRLGRRARVGEAVTLIGFGVTDDDERLAYRVQDRRHKTGLTIADVGPDSVKDVTTFPPRSLLLVGPSGCVGDSGGPLVTEETGAIVGVYSLLADAACSDSDVRHHFVHVPAFKSLIDTAFAAASAEPTLEPHQGEAGASGAPTEPPRERSSDGSCRAARSPSDGAATPLGLLALWLLRRRAASHRRPSSGSLVG